MLSDSIMPGSSTGAPRCRGGGGCPRAAASASAARLARGTEMGRVAARCIAKPRTSAAAPSRPMRQAWAGPAVPCSSPSSTASATGPAPSRCAAKPWSRPRNVPAVPRLAGSSIPQASGPSPPARTGGGAMAGQAAPFGCKRSSRQRPWQSDNASPRPARVLAEVSSQTVSAGAGAAVWDSSGSRRRAGRLLCGSVSCSDAMPSPWCRAGRAAR